MLNKRRVIVWWRHPRYVYSEMIEDKVWREAGGELDDHWPLEGSTPNYRRLGKSRKKIVSYTSHAPTEDQQRYYDVHNCTHHSQARGGQPRSRQIRSLSWVITRWAGTVRPRIITLENVKQIQQWGPLIAKRDAKTGRVMRLDGTVAGHGERVPLSEQYLVPDKKRLGATWRGPDPCELHTAARDAGECGMSTDAEEREHERMV